MNGSLLTYQGSTHCNWNDGYKFALEQTFRIARSCLLLVANAELWVNPKAPANPANHQH
jgi:hypothetical protein